RPSARRAPGKIDLAILERDLLRFGLEINRLLLPSPDILSAVVCQLELELVLGRTTAHPEGKGVGLGQPQSELLACHDKSAASLEVEIHPQGHAFGATLTGDLQIGLA